MNYFQCDCCGRFVSYADIDSGRAIYREITPDSAFTQEEYLTLCPTCKENDNETVTSKCPVGSRGAPSRSF